MMKFNNNKNNGKKKKEREPLTFLLFIVTYMIYINR